MNDPGGYPLLMRSKGKQYPGMNMLPKVGFLDLPAELRNEIYTHLIENVDTNVGPKTIRLRPRAEFSSYWRKKNTHRGEVYALNQVCRTTRHEFGPLYVSDVAHRVRVDSQLLPRFLHDFFLGEFTDSTFWLKPRKIEIELIYPLGGSPPRINVLPLLSLTLGNEDLQCTFLNKFGQMPEVDTLFRDHAVSWGNAILDDLLEILLFTPAGTTTCVDLIFRDDANHAFIDDIRTKKYFAPRSMLEYLEALGGSDMGTWDARVGVWNPQARVDFMVSKRTPGPKKQVMGMKAKAFETQYRLVQN